MKWPEVIVLVAVFGFLAVIDGIKVLEAEAEAQAVANLIESTPLHDFDDYPIEGDDALQLARSLLDAAAGAGNK